MYSPSVFYSDFPDMVILGLYFVFNHAQSNLIDDSLFHLQFQGIGFDSS